MLSLRGLANGGRKTTIPPHSFGYATSPPIRMHETFQAIARFDFHYQTMKNTLIKLATLSTSGILFASCAGTAPNARTTKAIPGSALVTANDKIKVNVTTAPNVEMLPSEKKRIEEKLEQRVANLKANKPSDRASKSFVTNVRFTEYDRGNAFARSMMAGLGQIKLKADVTHYDGKQAAGEFKIDKTFAWGGIYGGVTSVEDVEGGMVDGVAKTLTGTK